MNKFFDALLNETEPMYDAAVADENGIEFWHYPNCNCSNNGHSTTKLVICAAVGVLVYKGMLSIDDKVTSFFSKDELPVDMDEKWNEVSIKDAMRHRCGFEHIPYNIDNDDDIVHIKDTFLKYVFSLKIEFEPGEHRKYSDEAYYLLAAVIGKVSGQPADEFIRDNIFVPLEFRQWAMAKSDEGIPIAGGGLYTRADDLVKLALTYAQGGIYKGRRIFGEDWADLSMENDFALTNFRDTDVFLKTGACGQCLAFSKSKKIAVCWHGYSRKYGNERNDRLLEAFCEYLKDK